MKVRQVVTSLMLVVLLALSLGAFPNAPGIHGHVGAMAPDLDTITVWHSWQESELAALDLEVRPACRCPA